MQEQGLLELVAKPVTQPLTSLSVPDCQMSWASPLGLMIGCVSAPSLPQLLDRATAIMQISSDMATSLGIELSYGPAKTCILVAQQRSPIAKHMQDMHRDLPDVLHVHDRLRQEWFPLQIVATYKHLGCILTADRCAKPEILYRASKAAAVTKALSYN